MLGSFWQNWSCSSRTASDRWRWRHRTASWTDLPWSHGCQSPCPCRWSYLHTADPVKNKCETSGGGQTMCQTEREREGWRERERNGEREWISYGGRGWGGLKLSAHSCPSGKQVLWGGGWGRRRRQASPCFLSCVTTIVVLRKNTAVGMGLPMLCDYLLPTDTLL